jgi:hypothetical protein
MKDTNRRCANDLEKTAHLPEKSLVGDTIFPAGLQVLRTRDPKPLSDRSSSEESWRNRNILSRSVMAEPADGSGKGTAISWRCATYMEPSIEKY